MAFFKSLVIRFDISHAMWCYFGHLCYLWTRILQMRNLIIKNYKKAVHMVRTSRIRNILCQVARAVPRAVREKKPSPKRPVELPAHRHWPGLRPVPLISLLYYFLEVRAQILNLARSLCLTSSNGTIAMASPTSLLSSVSGRGLPRCLPQSPPARVWVEINNNKEGGPGRRRLYDHLW